MRLSKTLAGMNVTLLGSVSRPHFCSNSPLVSLQISSSPSRTNQRNTPLRSLIGSPLSASIHHSRKVRTHESGSGFVAARTYPLTPDIERQRESRYQN